MDQMVINKLLRAYTTYMRRESKLRRNDDPNVALCLVDSWLTYMYVLAKQLQAAAAVMKGSSYIRSCQQMRMLQIRSQSSVGGASC